MPIPQTELESALKKSFPNAQIEVLDLVGDSDHYRVTIVDEIFKDKTRVAQHRLVNDALRHYLKQQLHAMQLITKSK